MPPQSFVTLQLNKVHPPDAPDDDDDDELEELEVDPEDEPSLHAAPAVTLASAPQLWVLPPTHAEPPQAMVFEAPLTETLHEHVLEPGSSLEEQAIRGSASARNRKGIRDIAPA